MRSGKILSGFDDSCFYPRHSYSCIICTAAKQATSNAWTIANSLRQFNPTSALADFELQVWMLSEICTQMLHYVDVFHFCILQIMHWLDCGLQNWLLLARFQHVCSYADVFGICSHQWSCGKLLDVVGSVCTRQRTTFNRLLWRHLH